MLKVQKPKILIIGAGAVGQVYGHHLALGGAEVSVLVKPKHKEEAIAGFSMKRHRLAGVSPQTHRFMPQAVFTSLQEARGIWHQVWICVPCTAYYFPPLSPSPFQGPTERATSVVEFLQRGGCPASVVPDARVQGALSSSLLMPVIVGLEHEGWDLARFKNSTTLLKSLDAAREAMNIVKAEFSVKRALLDKAINPKLIKVALSVAPSLTPFPLQSYLEVHFTKVRPQTDAMMQRYIMVSEKHDLPASKIASLYALWRREVAASLSQAMPAVTTPAPAGLPLSDVSSSQNLQSSQEPADTSLTIGIAEGLEEETDP